MIGPQQQFRAGFAGGVRAVRFQRVALSETTLRDAPVHLVSADLMQALNTVVAGGIQQHVGAHHIGLDEGVGGKD